MHTGQSLEVEIPDRRLSAACLWILLPLYETQFYNNFKIENEKDLSSVVCSWAFIVV